ncbi:fungal-specific transcription factor domain-containing protein [Podospora conica]|nr:fungal-specific transcription factor domain-containing protein [Schizothecium conicum]
MEEITALTGDLRTHDEHLPSQESETADPGLDSDISRLQGPVLLLGGFPRVPIEEPIALLPARPVVDRMVNKFFEAKQPAWMIFHIPVFMTHYKTFWEGTANRNYTFVGLIFVMCSHAALYSKMASEVLPGNLGDSLEMFNLFRVRAAQCLTLGDYTKPGLYKVQAMFLHYGSEFVRQNEAILGASTLLCITIRLAMHMGMHRDPRHYPGMTPYEGEMRRRMWSVLVEVDLLISFQFGLPSNITPGSYDTELPRNLHDEDFDEDSIHLPPSRPETELTWQATRSESSEADRGFKLLAKMLAMSTDNTARNTPDPQAAGKHYDWMMAPLLPLGVDAGSSLLAVPARTVPLPDSSQRPTDDFTPWPPSKLDHNTGQLLSTWAYDIPVPALMEGPPLEGLEVLDPNLGSSWSLFDNQMQNPSNEPHQIPWDAFFQNH